MNKKKMPIERDEVETLGDLYNYVERYSRSIYVREQVDGVWCSAALASLPGDLAIKHAVRFFREGIIPYRLKQES